MFILQHLVLADVKGKYEMVIDLRWLPPGSFGMSSSMKNGIGLWAPLKIQSSPKCKARKKFASIRCADCLLTPLRSAAYV